MAALQEPRTDKLQTFHEEQSVWCVGAGEQASEPTLKKFSINYHKSGRIQESDSQRALYYTLGQRGREG